MLLSNLKSTIILCLVLFLSISVKAQVKNYVITGNLANNDGKFIYLSFNSKKTIDSSLINSGKFSFTGYISDMDIVSLTLGEEMFRTVLQQGKLKIEALDGDLYHAKVSGQQPAVDFNACKLLADSFQNLLIDIKERHSVASKNKDTITMIQLGKLNDQVYVDQTAAFNKWIEKHPNSMIAPLMIQSQLKSLPVTRLDSIYSLLSDPVKKSKGGYDLAQYIDSKKKLRIGKIAPEFTQLNENGAPVSLNSFKGNYVFIDFWASWCAPCRLQNPDLIKIYNQYKDRNFKILGVSLDDDKNNWLKAIKDDQLIWQQVSDLKGWNNDVVKRYNVQAIPNNYLISPDGKIISINENLKQLSERLSLLLN